MRSGRAYRTYRQLCNVSITGGDGLALICFLRGVPHPSEEASNFLRTTQLLNNQPTFLEALLWSMNFIGDTSNWLPARSPFVGAAHSFQHYLDFPKSTSVGCRQLYCTRLRMTQTSRARSKRIAWKPLTSCAALVSNLTACSITARNAPTTP